MFSFFHIFSISTDICGSFYSSMGSLSCPICISHYIDYKCGWCRTTGKCQEITTSTCPSESFIFGPNQACNGSKQPAFTPTPAPTPIPISGDCSQYTSNDGGDLCDICTSHYKDRNCGYCAETNKCLTIEEGKSQCNATKFYYQENAKCGEEILPPAQPWPQYEVNTTFCQSLSGSWCGNCITKGVNYSCGWCGATKECMMAKLDGTGPLMFKCEKDWSSTEDDTCKGISSKKTIVAIRVSVGIIVGIIVTLCAIGCYFVIRKNPEKGDYEDIQ